VDYFTEITIEVPLLCRLSGINSQISYFEILMRHWYWICTRRFWANFTEQE